MNIGEIKNWLNNPDTIFQNIKGVTYVQIPKVGIRKLTGLFESHLTQATNEGIKRGREDLLEEAKYKIVGAFLMQKMMYEHKTAEEVLEMTFRILESLDKNKK